MDNQKSQGFLWLKDLVYKSLNNIIFFYFNPPGRITVITFGCRPDDGSSTLSPGIYLGLYFFPSETLLSRFLKRNIYISVRLILPMEEIAITRISSKGQVVIPLEMREGLKEGDKMVIMKNDGQIILKKADKFSETLEEDLEFAKRTEEAWKRYEKGEFKEMEFDYFIEEMKKW
jgi:AbrB family looped-hinge helix DNA binding protein